MKNTELEKAFSNMIMDSVVTQAIGKKWYFSKTFWVNAVVVAAVCLQMNTGFLLTPELQTLVLAGVNIVLRKMTKEEIVW